MKNAPEIHVRPVKKTARRILRAAGIGVVLLVVLYFSFKEDAAEEAWLSLHCITSPALECAARR